MRKVNKEYKLRIVQPEELELNNIKGFLKSDTDGCFLPFSILALLYLFYKKRTSSKSEIQNYLLIKDDYLLVRNNEKEEKYNYSKLNKIKFHFNSTDYEDNNDPNEFLRLEFMHNAKELNFYIISGRRKAKNICTFLYGNKVDFKEYRNGTRVFLGEPKKYKEIQELKKQFGIEW